MASVASQIEKQAEEKGLAFTVRVAEELPALAVGDPALIRQILLNVLGNAIKFTPAGRVDLRVDYTRRSPGAGNMLVTVRDTGVGIPAEKIPLVFDAFTQADRSVTRPFGGSGLGLTIAYKITALMGGRLWLESSEGEGTSVFLDLPVRMAQTSTSAAV
jgi:signal transduction histidine kinase